MIIGDMEIRLRADIARLQRDMDEARRVAGGAMDSIGRAAGVAKAAIGALGLGLSVAAFGSWIKGAIDAADAASKLSARTGVAVKDIAGLQLAYDLGGAGGEVFAKSMAKLSKEMVDGGKNLGMLGIKSKDVSGAFRSTKDVMYDAADAFAGMQDGAQKTAMAMEIFGKSGAELIPLLNGGAAGFREMDEMARKLGLTMSAETAADAEKFNDTLDMLQMGSQGVARGIAAELLPTLSSLAGSLLESMTSGDKLKNTAAFLASGLKLLYTVGIGIVEVFSTVGKTIGAAGAQIVAIMSGDFKMAAQIGREWSKDIGDNWAGTAKAISDAWSNEGNAAVEAQAKIIKAQKDLLAEQKKREEATKKAVKDHESAVKGADDFIAAMRVEGAQIGLTADQVKMLTAARAASKAPLAEQRMQIMDLALANDIASKAETSRADAEKLNVAAMKAANDAAAQDIASIYTQTQALEFKIKTYGLLPAAITAVQIAELEASKQSLALTDLGIADIQRKIDALKGLASAQGSSEALEANKKLNDQIVADTKKMSESIENSLTDALMRGFESGKSFGRNLMDVLKNMFKTLVLRPTIQAILAPVSGSIASMMSGSAQAATGGSDVMSIAQSAQAAYKAISMGFDGIATTVADTVQGIMYQSGMTTQIASNGTFASGAGAAAGYTVGAAVGVYGGRAISNGYAVGGGSGNAAVNIGTIAGAILGGPIGAAISGLIGGAVNRLFGMREKEITSTTLAGSFGANGFSGSTDSAWKQKGGVFRSDKSGVDSTAIDAVTAKAFAAGYDALKAASVDFATVLGVNADAIATRSQSMSIAITKDAAANEKAIAQFFIDAGDAMARELVPSLADFAREGEGASATLQRIAGNYAFIDAALDAIGMTFGAVGLDSVAARERLIELSGGIELLGKGSAFFAQTFLTEAERLAPVQKQVTEQMTALGLAGVTTREQFKQTVLGLDLTTESGATTFAGLMKVQEAFALVTPALDDTAAAGRAASDILSDARTALSEAYEREADAIKATQDRMSSFATTLRGLRDSSLLGNLSTLTPQQKYEEARTQYERTLTSARAGDAGAQGNYQAAYTAFLTASQTVNASGAMYQRDFAYAQASTDEAIVWAAQQVDVGKASLAALDQQVSGLITINASVLTVTQAINALATTMGSTGAGVVSGSQTNAIESLYQSLLGRQPDTAGMQFWQQQMTNGVSLTDISAAIGGSMESGNAGAGIRSLYTSLLGREPDAAGMDYWQEQMMGGVSLFDISTAISQSAERTGQSVAVNYAAMGTSSMAPLVAEIKSLRTSNEAMLAELKLLRADAQQQTGDSIQANFDANDAAAEKIAEATTEAARIAAAAGKSSVEPA